MLALLGAVAFLLGAIFQAFNGPDLDSSAAWPFWLLVGLMFCALHSAYAVAAPRPARPVRRQ